VALPQSLVPMQPMLGKPFHRPGWIYEEKYDGWRMMAFKDGPRVRLISRQGVDTPSASAISPPPSPHLRRDAHPRRRGVRVR
jgi:ATP-dependent DNA ligase